MPSEEDFVRSLIERTGGADSLIGDDCAVVDEFSPSLLLTVDAMNESIHYDSGYSSRQIGHKLAGINLSDIHAMGGEPRWALLSITSNRDEPDLNKLLDGVIDRLDQSGVRLSGGDFSSFPSDNLESIVLTVIGQANPDGLLRRERARPGDRIAVTGPLGASGAILSQPAKQRLEPDQTLLANPPDTGEIARALVNAGGRAGIDISDGFLKDLSRLLSASHVGARIDPTAIPIHERAKTLAGDKEKELKWALTGGEDYELLVTIPEDTDLGNLRNQLSFVGTVTEGTTVQWDPPLPNELDLDQSGYDHFSVPN